MPTRPNWSRVANAWRQMDARRRGRRTAVVVVAAAAVGMGGCAGLKTPSAVGGKNAATRSLSPEQLREIAATFEAQGRVEQAQQLFAVADRRSGVAPVRPDSSPRGGSEGDDLAPPSPIPPAPTQLVEASPESASQPTSPEPAVPLAAVASAAPIVAPSAVDVPAVPEVDLPADADPASDERLLAETDVLPKATSPESAAPLPEDIALPEPSLVAVDGPFSSAAPDAEPDLERIPVLFASVEESSAASVEGVLPVSASAPADDLPLAGPEPEWMPAEPGVARLELSAPAGWVAVDLALPPQTGATVEDRSAEDSPSEQEAFVEKIPYLDPTGSIDERPRSENVDFAAD